MYANLIQIENKKKIFIQYCELDSQRFSFPGTRNITLQQIVIYINVNIVFFSMLDNLKKIQDQRSFKIFQCLFIAQRIR